MQRIAPGRPPERIPGTSLEMERVGHPPADRLSGIEQRGQAGPDSVQAAHSERVKGKESAMITILLVVAVLMLLGVLPRWSHSRSWGYGPSGGVGLIVVVLVVLLLSGRL